MNRFKHIASGTSLALVLALTVSVGCVFLAIAVVEIADGLMENGEPPHAYFREELAVSEEGSPMILRRQMQPFNKLEAFDLDHQPIERPVDKPLVILVASLSEEPPRQRHWLQMVHPVRRVQRVGITGEGGESWFVVFDGNRSDRFFLQGLNPDDGRTVAYIGREGFQQTKPAPADQFILGPLQPLTRREGLLQAPSATNGNRGLLLDDRQLLSIDFLGRTVGRLIDEPILSLENRDRWIAEFEYMNRPDKAEWTARTAERVMVLNLNDGTERSFLIPQDSRDERFGFFALDEGAIYFTPSGGEDLPTDANAKEQTSHYELLWATDSGEITQRKPLALANTVSSSSDGLSDEADLRIMTAMVPATLWSAGMAFVLHPLISSQIEEELDFPQAFRQSAGQLWWVVLLVALLCGWLAWLTFQHQRRQKEPDGWFWAVFVFFFGLPGYLGYRMHRSWPHSEPIPAPKPTGLEVFAH